MRRITQFTFLVAIALCVCSSFDSLRAEDGLKVGVAEVDITPPVGFPMAGYYHERLAEGSIDPLKAKAIVFRSNNTAAALVVCDLIGISTDLSRAARKRASDQTKIAESNIVVSATHSHTAPDYGKELFLFLGNENRDPLRKGYIEKLIDGIASAIVKANTAAEAVTLNYGVTTQDVPVSFNRRSVMKDGTVRTWVGHDHPDFIRAAGPIDPEIGILSIQDQSGKIRGILSNFALHLDGGERNKTDFIGKSIGESIQKGLGKLKRVGRPNLFVQSKIVRLPMQDATKEEVANSIKVLDAAKRKEKVDFFDHVTAYKKMIIDQFRHTPTYGDTFESITWGLSRSLAGIGDTLPVEVTTITLGQDLAIVCLPGEVFVDLGLAIKHGSPFRTTMVIELSNCVETIYLPHRSAYAGGSYEVTNSLTAPGSGEMLVEAALGLLRDAATANLVVK